MKFNELSYGRILLLLFACFVLSSNVHATLDGTSTPIYLDYHYVFEKAEAATGFVSFQDGFTIPAGFDAYIDIEEVVYGGIDLRGSGILEVDGDLMLARGLTFSSSGVLNCGGNTIFLEGDIAIPDNVILTFYEDAIIDGQGHQIDFGRSAKFFLDVNVTLTLKNMKLKSTYNDLGDPFLNLPDGSSKLALDNVIICPGSDFDFIEGELFIHNDVVFTGTHTFIYESTAPCYITSQATWTFKPRTTFYYDGDLAISNELIVMEDENSNLFFDQCTIYITHTGLRLTKGSVFFDNFVTIKTGEFAPPFDLGLIFGDSSKNDAMYNVSTYVLAGAQVDIQGTVFYDDYVFEES